MTVAEELMTLKEAQEYLGVSRVKIWKLTKEGNLSIYTDPLDKRKKLVPKAEVEKLKQPRAIRGAAPAAPTKPAAAAPIIKPHPRSIPLSEVAKMPFDEAVRLSKGEAEPEA